MAKTFSIYHFSSLIFHWEEPKPPSSQVAEDAESFNCLVLIREVWWTVSSNAAATTLHEITLNVTNVLNVFFASLRLSRSAFDRSFQ